VRAHPQSLNRSVVLSLREIIAEATASAGRGAVLCFLMFSYTSERHATPLPVSPGTE
jgi:hypothetical protein